MRNILIPTTLEPDTCTAVLAAIKHASGSYCTIVLMLFAQAPDAGNADDQVSQINPAIMLLNNVTLKRCRMLLEGNRNCNLQVHHQYGVSAPLLRNLFSHKQIDLVVLPDSFKNHPDKIYRDCTRLLLKSKYPLLLPGNMQQRSALNRALYITHSGTVLSKKCVEELLAGKFPYSLHSQTRLPETDGNMNYSALEELITKEQIEVLIATRNIKRCGFKNPEEVFGTVMGLPLLSLYED